VLVGAGLKLKVLRKLQDLRLLHPAYLVRPIVDDLLMTFDYSGRTWAGIADGQAAGAKRYVGELLFQC
jgi:hypothetical protein